MGNKQGWLVYEKTSTGEEPLAIFFNDLMALEYCKEIEAWNDGQFCYRSVMIGVDFANED